MTLLTISKILYAVCCRLVAVDTMRLRFLAIDFSVSDTPSVGKLRDELLDLLEKTYNWKIVKYTIDGAVSWTIALWNLDQAVHNFTYKYASRGQGRSLLTFCFSGHGFADKENNSIYVAYIGAERVGYRLQKHLDTLERCLYRYFFARPRQRQSSTFHNGLLCCWTC